MSLSFSTVRFFKPYAYVENNTSYLMCDDGSRFETGPNSIFSLESRLDPVNDKKARKLCQYKIIRDYGDTYKASSQINYRFYPDIKNESSWINAVLAGVTVFILGSVLIEALSVTLFHKDAKFLIFRSFIKLIT